MRILQVHNQYQNAGGEAVVVDAEYNLLVEKGHTVQQWIVENAGIEEKPFLEKANIARKAIWSSTSQKQIAAEIEEFHPEIVHVHNTIPQITPSIYCVVRQYGIPVVQTLHNYRFICPKSVLYRNGKLCETCVGKLIPYPAIIHGCFRQSRLQSVASVSTLAFNRIRGTYDNDIDIYIALTEFARNKLIEGGLPGEKIMVKSNFIKNTEIKHGEHNGDFAIYAGRLESLKGVQTLVEAWRYLEQPIPIKILGDGDLNYLMNDAPPGIEYLGRQPRGVVLKLMQEARVMLFPSECYEGFPMSIAEALAVGLPVIASRLGSPGEIVHEGETGWLFTSGDAHDLARVTQEAWANPEEMKRRGRLAIKQYEDFYTADKNYLRLIEIYNTALAKFSR